MGECQESVRADRYRWSEGVRETWLSCDRCWKSVGIGTRGGFIVRMRERKLWIDHPGFSSFNFVQERRGERSHSLEFFGFFSRMEVNVHIC